MISTATEEELRRRIDALQLSPHLQRLRARYFEEAPQVCAERLKFALQALRETDGEPIDIRSAKKLKAVLAGVSIVIHDGDMTAGNQTRLFRGSAPNIDWDAGYFEKVADGHRVTFGSPAEVGSISEEDWQVCREAAAYFRGRTPAEADREVAKALFGEWYEDAMAIRAVSYPYEQVPYFPGVPMWDKLLKMGMRGIVHEAEAGIERFRETDENDPEKIYFWQAIIIVCQAVVEFAHRHAQLARDLAFKERDATRRRELEDIADTCEWVPENPARTFHEAVQSIRLTHVALLMENTRKGADLGRLDQLLYPYFRKDMDEGQLTLEKAADLLGDFITYVARLEQVHNRLASEVAQNTMINHIVLGGATRDGTDVSNGLTYLILHMLGLLRYAEPHATVRLHEGTPSWLMMKALETNRKVNGIPMYLNDKHITETIHASGVPLEEACEWALAGCSQPVLPSQGHYKPMHINTAVSLDLALHNGVSPLTGKKVGIATGDPRAFQTFDEVFAAYKEQYRFVIRRLLRLQRFMHLAEAQGFRMPLRSALDHATIQNGKSHLTGGSDSYPLWHMKDRALVDVADSLTAIKQLVFDDRKLTLGELLEALDSDFGGEKGEEIRQMCLAAPKYGNDIDEADYMLRDVGKFSASVIMSEKNCFGWPYSINRNGVAWHYAGGKGVGALPNGRHARAPFADGSLSPMNGMDRNGPTAVLNSALKADFREALVGILNQRFPVTVVHSPEAMRKIAALTSTFVARGGLHIQYNFVDKEVLLDAKKHPERHKDLVVRVAGYSAYFVNLTPEVQDEIINRTEQCL
ncbi:MAG: hypothetical protein HYX92_15920 [Chloroflexi bacterium]|nr:hypothetical protein [Chloroflexota bacterium]